VEKITVLIGSDGFIAHSCDSDRDDKTFVCSEIRGAVTPPTISDPGYYIIFGQKNERNESGKKPLLLLAEGSSNLQEELFDKLIADISDSKCQGVYLNQQHINFNISLSRRLKKQHEGVKLIPVPVQFEEDNDYGLPLIKQWIVDKALYIPKDTILAKELGKMTSGSISFVIDPLKWLIGGFEICERHFSPEAFEEKKKSENRKSLTGISAAAWDEIDRYRAKVEEQRQEYEMDLFELIRQR
jgi:hypothetical protein